MLAGLDPLRDAWRNVPDDTLEDLPSVDAPAAQTLSPLTCDPLKLASRGLTVADIRNALATIAFDTPAGSINGPNQNITVRAISEVTTAADFENIIINGRTRLGDVASVVFDAAASTSALRSDGKPGIGLGIVRQAQSNTIDISEGVHAAVDVLNETLPAGVDIKVSSDDAVFIDGLTAPTRLRGKVDDAPALATPLHAGHHGLDREDRAAHVHIVLATIVLHRHFLERAHVEDAGVVDEYVDTVPGRLHRFDTVSIG